MSEQDKTPTANRPSTPSTGTKIPPSPATAGSQADVETGSAAMASSAAPTGSTTPPGTGTASSQPDTKVEADAKSMADDAKGMAKETKDAAASRASELADGARAKAAEMGDQAKDMASAKAEEAKGYATSEIDRQAESIRSAGREFGDDSYQAHAADYLAQNLSQAAEVIRGKDMGDLVDDLSLFARRNPGLFLGGAALLGFAAVRLMKASERSRPRMAGTAGTYGEDRFDAPVTGVRNTPYASTAESSRFNGGYRQ